jgi:1-acyl-sn-glycerol-3-phosphate acyltransferase
MSNLKTPAIGPLVPRRGNRVSRWLGRWMMVRKGWEFHGEVPDMPRAVVIAAPHTSNWDGYYAIGTMMALSLRLSIMAKDSLFKWYISWFFKWIGFLKVNRDAPGGFVEKCAATLKDSKGLWMVMAPEGTRTNAKKWKSGFHRIAQLSGAPILPISIDYQRKRVVFGEPKVASDNYAQDLDELLDFFAECGPHSPELLSVPLAERMAAREKA